MRKNERNDENLEQKYGKKIIKKQTKIIIIKKNEKNEKIKIKMKKIWEKNKEKIKKLNKNKKICTVFRDDGSVRSRICESTGSVDV